METLIFWTGNTHKLSEATEIMKERLKANWLKLKWYSKSDLARIKKTCVWWEIPEIQSMDIMEIVKRKAKDVYWVLCKPVIVEDTWLYIDALKWFPGPLVKYIIEWPGLDAIFKMMEEFSNRSARAITWVCMYNWEEYITWYWELEWNITTVPRWDKFWYSNAFEVAWTGKTFWEMTEEEKNQISMRKIAFLDFMNNLESSIK